MVHEAFFLFFNHFMPAIFSMSCVYQVNSVLNLFIYAWYCRALQPSDIIFLLSGFVSLKSMSVQGATKGNLAA